MTGEAGGPADVERGLRRQLRWAYAINITLAALLVLSLFRTRSEEPMQQSEELSGGGYKARFDVCFERLSAGEYESALAPCEEAVELAPRNLNALHNLGFAYRSVGDFEAAIETFERVLAEDPLNVRSLYELANAHAEAGQREEARDTLERLLQVQPDHGWAKIRLEELAD